MGMEREGEVEAWWLGWWWERAKKKKKDRETKGKDEPSLLL
jgi:hypothetical protein